MAEAFRKNFTLYFAMCKVGTYRLFQAVFSRCFKCLRCRPEKQIAEYRILCVGLTGAGKSTLLSKLNGEDVENIQPTTGFAIKTIRLQTVTLNIMELGGGDNVRTFWHKYFKNVDGIMFVLDSSCQQEKLKETKQELEKILSHSLLKDVPFLIVANKCDIPDAKTLTELESALDMACLKTISVHQQVKIVESGSDDNVKAALTEFSSTVCTSKKTRHDENASNRI